MSGEDPGADNFKYERVGSDHPMWVLFSTGTTGLPKAIVHGHTGILIELLKTHNFHINLKPGDVGFFYTTAGWMMFNYVVTMLLTGATAVLYDGNPAHPTPDVLWKMAADTRATSFGASPTFVQVLQNLGLEPGKTHDLSALSSIILGGAPSTPETFEWFYKSVKSDLWVTSLGRKQRVVDRRSWRTGVQNPFPVPATLLSKRR
jgi:acetoacetyl-CoA synthetase